MTTSRSRVILVAVLALAAAAACKKDKKPAEGGGGAAASGQVRSTLAMFPKETDGVVGIDVAGLRGSELYKAHEPRLQRAAASALREVQALCGFDPLPRLQRVVLGGAGRPETGDLTAVVDGLGKAEVMACLQKAAASPPPGASIEVDGDYARVEAELEAEVPLAGDQPPPPRAPTSVAVQFLDDDTVVIARRGGRAPDAAAMAAILAARDGEGLTGSAPFMELANKVDTRSTVWFVVSGRNEAIRRAGRGFLSFDAAWGGAKVTDALGIDASIRLESEAAAKETAELVDQQVGKMRKSMMKDMIGDVAVKHDGRDVRFQVTQTRKQLEKLVDFAGMMLGTLLE